MALTNFNIIQLVNLATNRDINTQAFTTEEYQTLINSNSIRLFKRKLGLPEEYAKDMPVAQEGVGVSKKIELDLAPFLTHEIIAVAGGVVDLTGKDIGYLEDFMTNPIGLRGMDYLKGDEIGDRINNPITAPTADDPVYYRTELRKFTVYPVSITSITAIYYKNPTTAVVVIDTNATTLLPEYNGGSSTELNWDDVNKIDIAYMIIRDAGLSVQRPDIVQLADNLVKTSK